jgi:pimeloyl-ACP methyl ester carboxylesterase
MTGTIVLVHGFWVTPRSWEDWIAHYEARGFRVVAPAYPGLEVEVEALNADPSPIAALTAPKIIAHLESVLDGLEEPPVIIGHSAGGAFTQILLDHGYGVAGVALNSAFTQGVRVTPPSQLRSVFPILSNPANRKRAKGYTAKQWHYVFANTFSREESDRLWERYAVPASGGILFEGVLSNFKPGRGDLFVDYRNEQRAPLLFVSGGADHIMPPSVQRSNARKYTSAVITERREYPGRCHLLPAEPGWEAIADHVLDWALANAGRTAAEGAVDPA